MINSEEKAALTLEAQHVTTLLKSPLKAHGAHAVIPKRPKRGAHVGGEL